MIPSLGVISGATPTKVFSFLLFLVALVIACAGSSPGAISTTDPFSLRQTPLEMLKHSIQTMESVESYRARLDVIMEAVGETIPLSMEMEIEVGSNNWVHNTIVSSWPDGGQTIEQVIAQPHVYTKALDQDWFRIDLEDLAERFGRSQPLFADPAEFANSFFPGDNIPWELYTVNSKGLEKIDGVQTEQLSIQLDFQELWDRLDSSTKGQFSQFLSAGDLGIPDILEEIELKKLEFWTDGQGYNRRLFIDILVGDLMSITLDMRLFDFNQDISIKLPEDYSDVPLP